jgi:hypothetical protein
MVISASMWAPGTIVRRFRETLEQAWYLGFTAFGGPPVHFKIVRFIASEGHRKGIDAKSNLLLTAFQIP